MTLFSKEVKIFLQIVLTMAMVFVLVATIVAFVTPSRQEIVSSSTTTHALVLEKHENTTSESFTAGVKHGHQIRTAQTVWRLLVRPDDDPKSNELVTVNHIRFGEINEGTVIELKRTTDGKLLDFESYFPPSRIIWGGLFCIVLFVWILSAYCLFVKNK